MPAMRLTADIPISFAFPRSVAFTREAISSDPSSIVTTLRGSFPRSRASASSETRKLSPATRHSAWMRAVVFITSPEKAKHVLDVTGADALMIGRAAQGRPWLFREIEHYLKTGTHLMPPRVSEIHDILLAHLEDLYEFYGRETGVRVARKHISWYTRGLSGSAAFRHQMNQLPDIALQQQAVNDFFLGLAEQNEHLTFIENENDSDSNNDDESEGLAA